MECFQGQVLIVTIEKRSCHVPKISLVLRLNTPISVVCATCYWDVTVVQTACWWTH